MIFKFNPLPPSLYAKAPANARLCLSPTAGARMYMAQLAACNVAAGRKIEQLGIKVFYPRSCSGKTKHLAGYALAPLGLCQTPARRRRRERGKAARY